MLSNIERMQNIKTVKDVDLENKKVLIRVDFNVPMDDTHNITDDTRIQESLPTIEYCIDHKVRYIVLVTHLGQPKEIDENFSTKHLLKRVSRLLKKDVEYVKDFESFNPEDGKVYLFENIRFFKGETKNDDTLSKDLANLCDVYINDAFGTSHREHSSTFGVAKYVPISVSGFLLKKELNAFAKALYTPIKPITLVVGGAKVSSKITLLKNIIPKVNKIVIGGAMSNTFLKALGYDMKDSLLENDYLEEARIVLMMAKEAKVNVYLPVDVVITDDVKNPTNTKIVPVQEIDDNFKALDIGPATVRLFEEVIGLSNTLIWNGPMGMFEIDLFSKGTLKIAHAIADTYAYTIAGGGDTVNAILLSGEKDNFSFISTGGGASLELLEGKILPGVVNLNQLGA
ncbi:MAG: phosphoglycerate kinase [Arcobacteraceae bacterium]|jgi:phosphoglycerate kinase|nr:phosphoglycerate kinase [Arcobacteraceae bacterium]